MFYWSTFTEVHIYTQVTVLFFMFYAYTCQAQNICHIFHITSVTIHFFSGVMVFDKVNDSFISLKMFFVWLLFASTASTFGRYQSVKRLRARQGYTTSYVACILCRIVDTAALCFNSITPWCRLCHMANSLFHSNAQPFSCYHTTCTGATSAPSQIYPPPP